MKKLILMPFLILCLFSCGCTSYSILPQTAHIIDCLQTLNVVDDERFFEANEITAAYIGEFPSHEEVVAWCVINIAVIQGAFYLLDKGVDNRETKSILSGIQTGYTLNTVLGNHNTGARIFGENEDPPTWR